MKIKTQFFASKKSPGLIPITAFLFLQCLLISCSGEKKTEVQPMKESSKEDESPTAIEIVTENMEFQVQDTIPSGWNLIRYKNMSSQTHFVLFDKYPEGKTLDTVREKVIPFFDSGMKLINEGNPEDGFAEFGKLPEWFGQVRFFGGNGLISPGQTSETAIYLEPGLYFIECYVKMNNGVFHASMGMIEDLVVSEEPSSYPEPEADVDIVISSTEGIVFNDSIPAGTHTFSVYFKDQIVHENFAGHDVNLVRLGENADLEALEKWMNWADPEGLIEPAPEGLLFMGGANNMPAGSKAYFKANLEPGNYVLIAEVPKARSKNMLRAFSVGD